MRNVLSWEIGSKQSKKPHQNILAREDLMFFHYLLLYIDVFFFFSLQKIDISVLFCVCNVMPARNGRQWDADGLVSVDAVCVRPSHA